MARNEHRTRGSALTRRALIAAAVAGGIAPVLAQGWFDLRDDNAEVVENMRVAVELVAAIDQLPGLIMLGRDVPFVRMIEFFDYNCPICRRAARDLELLVGTDGDLGVELVHNPILAPSSRTAAAHAIAIATRRGPGLALRFHAEMFSSSGPVSPLKLRTVVDAIGLDPDAVERDADAMAPAVKEHADLAASLGFAVTPSFVLGSVSLLGYPGPASMRRLTESAAKCGDVQCS